MQWQRQLRPLLNLALKACCFHWQFWRFFYFLFLRPQAKKAKEKKQMISALNKGVEVVTSGGILGKVVDLDDNFVRLEVGDNTFIQVQRQSIETLLPKGTYKAVTKKGS